MHSDEVELKLTPCSGTHSYDISISWNDINVENESLVIYYYSNSHAYGRQETTNTITTQLLL